MDDSTLENKFVSSDIASSGSNHNHEMPNPENPASRNESPGLTAEGMERFLASSWVDGIGPAFARRLVDRFGLNAADILLSAPEKALDVPGMGETRVSSAAESLRKIKWPFRLLLMLFSSGVGDLFINRIFGKYRNKAERIIMEDPYSMVEEVWQLSFFTADKIGKTLGIPADDPRRLRGALLTAVKHFAEQGHLFAAPEEALDYASSITGVSREKFSCEIDALADKKRIVKSRGGLYLPVFYNAEKQGAERLAELSKTQPPRVSGEDIPRFSRHGHAYSPRQRDAIGMALNSPVMVLTGGPGSGKTTVLRGVIDILEREGRKVVLAAPTGRAAKRMTTLTGVEASTIHRLLGYRQGEGYFAQEISADVLIIDEGSMMEQVLFNHLLQALTPGTRVILVGDADQLPAIGAGDVMRGMMESGVIPVVVLDENFRQEAGSLISSGARAINSGDFPESDVARDFMIFEEQGTARIRGKIISLMTQELPRLRGISPKEIRVVTPQQIGFLGARQLNIELQKHINPEGPALRRGETVMRLGDPVMQTANSRERGVYNGETGEITGVDEKLQTLEVTFSDGRKSTYSRSEMSELVLAYATTVHKLQGSEVGNMIFPVTMAHKPMLYRNLLYTGVSRATDLCVLVGEGEAIKYAIGHDPAKRRNSNFAGRLRGCIGDAAGPREKLTQE